jgi:hypothetical protein
MLQVCYTQNVVVAQKTEASEQGGGLAGRFPRAY